MSESNDSRIEARECLRKANRGDDSQNRWAWLVLTKSWLSLARIQEIAENSIEASRQAESTPALSLGLVQQLRPLSNIRRNPQRLVAH